MENQTSIAHHFFALILLALAVITALVMMPQAALAAEQTKETVGSTNTIYRQSIQTATKATIAWGKVREADGYLVYQKKANVWSRVAKTTRTSLNRTSLARTNQFKVVAYKKVGTKTVRGEATAKTVTMPTVITEKTRGYKGTYGYKVIQKAKTKYGARYVWGASGPRVFDCSGFTYWTYNNCGVSGIKFYRMSSRSLYRSYKCYSLGRSLSKAQTGDILLFGHGGSTSSIYHVGMYDKNGYYVHANGTKVVRSLVPTGQLVAVIRLPGLR